MWHVAIWACDPWLYKPVIHGCISLWSMVIPGCDPWWYLVVIHGDTWLWSMVIWTWDLWWYIIAVYGYMCSWSDAGIQCVYHLLTHGCTRAEHHVYYLLWIQLTIRTRFTNTCLPPSVHRTLFSHLISQIHSSYRLVGYCLLGYLEVDSRTAVYGMR